MKWVLEILVLLPLITISNCNIEEQPMPSILCDCFSRNKCDITKEKADVIHFKCINYYLAHTYQDRWYKNISGDALNYVLSLQREANQAIESVGRKKRQANGNLFHGIRKELRTLSREERTRFYAAVNSLKNNRIGNTNSYEALASIHNTNALNAAHFGVAFPGWHRYFLFLFEQALRRFDRTVTLPYIDTTMENSLPNPWMSNLWSAEGIGNIDGGQVRVGPFANWRYQTQDRRYVPLTRNGGSARDYFPADCYRNIIRESRNSRILEPLAGTNRNLEACHNYAHATIGGTMNDIDVSPNDPVFYLHHCYVDKVWQDFRDNAKSVIGNDFEFDYPVTADMFHQPNRAMGNLNEFTNSMGYLKIFDERITNYAPSPGEITCTRSSDCQSPQFLRCSSGRCIPILRSSSSPFGRRKKRDVEYEDDEYKSVMDSSYQNNFVIDGEADVSLWAFIPVTLMYIRPMGQHFGCNAVRNGSIDDNDDIYSNDKTSKLWDYFKPGVDKRRVSDSQSGATKFFVQSDGISYKGRYIDYGIIDTRQMVYETVAYVGVKNPRSGSSTSYVSVYDLHGHVCQPRCIDRSSKTLFYKKCSGVIKLTKEEPQMYGDDIAEAVRYRYTYNFDGYKPTSNYRDIFLQFVCEYGAEYPWKDCSSV